MGSVVVGILSVLYVFICLFMILVVLLQKGEGGGLAGAFGGMGGESAFGVKGDKTFKKLTGVVGGLFLVVAIVLGAMIERSYQGATAGGASSEGVEEAEDGSIAPTGAETGGAGQPADKPSDKPK